MAAYAALVSTLKLLNQMDHQICSSVFAGQVQPLIDNFTFLLSFLEHLPPNFFIHGEGEIQIHPLETRISDAAYDAQNIIDSYKSHVSSLDTDSGDHNPKRKTGASWRLMATLHKFVSSNSRREKAHIDNNSVERIGASRDLQKVVQETDYLVNQATQMKRNWESRDVNPVTINGSRAVLPRGFPERKMNTVGLDDDLLQVKHQLCGGSSKLSVIPILGMGGIGKTTLANNVYNDPVIGERFDCRAWTTVTQSYTVERIVDSLLNSIIGIPNEARQQGEESSSLLLYQTLKGRRYLIVLDDMWSIEAWDDTGRLLPDDDNGSRIILTTRLESIALYADSFGNSHRIKFLNEDESWELLRRNVFLDEERCPVELENIGRTIARNCSGLPLSIVVIAGLLSKTERITELWENIARDVGSFVAADDEDVQASKVLLLSYNHLPHHLKPCFLYLGGFPQGYQIPVFELVAMWLAEGFLKSDDPKCSEKIAQEYLEELVSTSLVLITKKSANGRFKLCGVHDLLRDVCIKRAKEDNFLHFVGGIEEKIMGQHRIGIAESVAWYHFKNMDTVAISKVRSLFCYSFNLGVADFSLLRVLDVLHVLFSSFPLEILRLIHLRYLSFTGDFIGSFTLPPSLSQLHNLETFIIRSSMGLNDRVLAAPFPIWKMSKLRHLIYPNILLSPFSLGTDDQVHVLGDLQTLYVVINLKFTKDTISMIPNLKKLKAAYRGEWSRQRSEFELNNLALFGQLETLRLKFQPSSDWWGERLPIPFNLPSNLRKLTLSGCGISWSDMSMIGSLPNLEILKLRTLSVNGEQWEPVEGEFCQLKVLLMEWLDLKDWFAESSHFPRLEHLIITHCSALHCIPSEIGDISTLQLIEIHNSERAIASAKLVLKEQRDMANEVLQVRIDGHLLRDEASELGDGGISDALTLESEKSKQGDSEELLADEEAITYSSIASESFQRRLQLLKNSVPELNSESESEEEIEQDEFSSLESRFELLKKSIAETEVQDWEASEYTDSDAELDEFLESITLDDRNHSQGNQSLSNMVAESSSRVSTYRSSSNEWLGSDNYGYSYDSLKRRFEALRRH